MIQQYLTWFLGWLGDAFTWLSGLQIVTGVSLLGFFAGVSILCIIIGMILIH